MKFNNLPLLDYLNECFSVDFNNGKLFWKKRPRYHFKTDSTWKKFNTQFFEKEAGSYSKGYYNVRIQNKSFMLHRIIYYMFHKEDISNILIDHRDRNRSNNSIQNLRKATYSQNMANSIKKNNTLRGSYYRKNRNSWYSLIIINKKKIYLGTFKTQKEAALAYKIKLEEVFKDFKN